MSLTVAKVRKQPNEMPKSLVPDGIDSCGSTRIPLQSRPGSPAQQSECGEVQLLTTSGFILLARKCIKMCYEMLRNVRAIDLSAILHVVAYQ